MSISVLFDTKHLYYLPQYIPVARELARRGVSCEFLFTHETDLDEVKARGMQLEGFRYHFVKDKYDAFNYYRKTDAAWIIFGNQPTFSASEKVKIPAKLALMQHGIGPKSCYYNVSAFPFDVRFVEGRDRLARLQATYPQGTFVNTGFAKLDPLFRRREAPLSLSALLLDPDKPTVLYAPTFFPSSVEVFPADWPAHLPHLNIIVKPHFFSLTKPNYHNQRARFATWSKYDNVHIAHVSDFDLLPFMGVADVMLSDASSAIFEFAALDKPAIWCDFSRTRWSYWGLLKFRLKKRLDPDLKLFHRLAHRASSPLNANSLIDYCLANSEEKHAERQRFTEQMVGKTDGKCSERIADYLLKTAS